MPKPVHGQCRHVGLLSIMDLSLELRKMEEERRRGWIVCESGGKKGGRKETLVGCRGGCR